MRPVPTPAQSADRLEKDPVGTFRLATAVVVGAYHGPLFNPGAGRLPVELGTAELDWAPLRDALEACRAEWTFDGTAAQAKTQVAVAINSRLSDGLSVVTSPSSYRAILDPITDEVIGHDYGGWVYRDGEPVRADHGGNAGVYATVFLCTLRAQTAPIADLRR